MKNLLSILLALTLTVMPVLALTDTSEGPEIPAPSALLMERSSGTVLYEKDAYTHYSPASVTKVMTLLLVMEALEAGKIELDTPVTASARAASMGGSQIWLEEGETMTVDEMIKCVAVVSANDCAVALAEHLAVTEQAFVSRMNERAAELGMKDSHFTNCTGLLESDEHYSCAYDIALMSRALLEHELIRNYTTIWMDTARDGAFGLSNTNRLIHSYSGATGLKTGYTARAKYCLAASAERDGVEYIAVVMHADSSAERFESATRLLDYGFANFDAVSLRPSQALPPLPVELGTVTSLQPVYNGPEFMVVEKGSGEDISYELDLPETVKAPVTAGQQLGVLNVKKGEELLARVPIEAGSSVDRKNLWDIFFGMLRRAFAVETG